MSTSSTASPAPSPPATRQRRKRRRTSCWRRSGTSPRRGRRRLAPRRRRRPGDPGRAFLRRRNDVGDPLGADPRLRPLGGRAGGRLQGGDAAPAPGRRPAYGGEGNGARRRIVVVLLRGGRTR